MDIGGSVVWHASVRSNPYAPSRWALASARKELARADAGGVSRPRGRVSPHRPTALPCRRGEVLSSSSPVPPHLSRYPDLNAPRLAPILGLREGLAMLVGIVIGVGILRTPGLIADHL